MKDIKNKHKAVVALKYIMPLLKKYNFRWCISGSLACRIYGVQRLIGDIDIEISKDDPRFKRFTEDVKEYTRLPFQLWIDKNYNNWVMDIVYNNQLLSICSTHDLKLFNKNLGTYEVFYKNGIPDPVLVNFEGLQLPLAPQESVLKMKQALAYPKAVELKDIREIQRIIESKI